MKKTALFLAMLLFSAALIGAGGPLQRLSRNFSVLSSTALDAASSTITVDMRTTNRDAAWGLLVLHFALTDADNSTTAVTMTCTESPDGGTTNHRLTSVTTASGVGTMSAASWVFDPSGLTTKNWTTRIDIEGMEYIVCTITDTGGVAADLLAVTANLATKGG